MMTEQQERFVQNYLQGMAPADAYRQAYPKRKLSAQAALEAADKLLKSEKVQVRLSKHTSEKYDIMTSQERLEWLTQLIRSDRSGTGDKLKAADMMNKMQGSYVTKLDGSLNVNKLEDLL